LVLKYVGRAILGAVMGIFAYFALFVVAVGVVGMINPFFLLTRSEPILDVMWNVLLPVLVPGGAMFALCFPRLWGKFLGWAVLAGLGALIGTGCGLLIRSQYPQAGPLLSVAIAYSAIPLVILFLLHRQAGSLGQRIGAKLV
jgi:hypothetical protein